MVAISVKAVVGWTTRKLLVTAALSLIGLVVGIGTVLLPMGIPIGIVGLTALLLLWVLPDLRTVPLSMGRSFFYAFVFVSLSVPAYYAIVLPGIPWISFRRLILFLFIIPTIITIAASSDQRKKIGEVLSSTKPLSVLVFGFLASMFLSTVFTVSPVNSISATVNTIMGLYIPLVAVVMFVRDERALRRIFILFTVCISIDFVLGFAEFIHKSPFLVYVIPASMRAQMLAQSPGFINMIIGQGSRNGLYRASSIFNVALSWGEVSAMMAPIAAHFFAHERGAWNKFIGLAGVAVCFVSVVCSGARGGYVGFIAAMITYLVIWSVRKIRTNPESLIGGLALTTYAMFSGGVLFAVFFVGQIHAYVLGSGGTYASNDARTAEWLLAKPKIFASPIWGYGPGNSGDIIGYYPFGSKFPTVDSYILTILVENGILGFLCFAGFLLFSIFLCIKIYILNKSHLSSFGGALACSLVAYTVYRITLSQAENNTTAFVLIGLVLVFCHLVTLERKAAVPVHDTRNAGRDPPFDPVFKLPRAARV